MPPLMLVIYVIRVIIPTIGIFTNIALIIVTYRNKSLRTTCNILIALGATANLFYDLGYIVSPILFATGIKFIPASSCFYFQLLSIYGVCSSAFFLLTVGLDRLVCIIAPTM
uniref:G-protein coupled receptors family 1 profile domain-containing protein n=1 Tax=Ditylenchus dipsaci TaxID=166011 RepID=A0A915DUN4_9BILA